ncbi:hypothetical protein D1AOALGA4SA_1277 [Olavius algarvensis Delta 1 endosymbiont]|nr:hypothetical protein D1AOALGA4SA_1277 [Olavius algarvensis Delta 1 endosymbiont]
MTISIAGVTALNPYLQPFALVAGVNRIGNFPADTPLQPATRVTENRKYINKY